MTTPRSGCPACGGTVRPVGARTVASLTGRSSRDAEGFSFCPAPECNVVYAAPSRGDIVRARDLSVVVFQKSAAPDRPVCYCFGHTVAEVAADAAATPPTRGSIVRAITDACRRGLDRCETTNPQGRCCLGNIRSVAKIANAATRCGADGPCKAPTPSPGQQERGSPRGR